MRYAATLSSWPSRNGKSATGAVSIRERLEMRYTKVTNAPIFAFFFAFFFTLFWIFYFSFFSIFISSFILTILKRLNLFSKKNLIVRYFEYNKKDNSNLKLLIIFTIFFVIRPPQP